MRIEDFAEELKQEVLSRCDNENGDHFYEDKFTEVMIEYLVGANEVEDGMVCFHKHNQRSEKINGFNLSPDGECLDLFVCFYQGGDQPAAISSSEIKQHFKWVIHFFEACLEGLYKNIEESSLVFDVAQRIFEYKDDISRVRLFFLTDGIVKGVDVEDYSVGSIPIKHFIWDLEKLRRFVESKMKREVIEINFKNDFGGGVPCIRVLDAKNEYQALLAFFPGKLLADLYGEHGPRLLERNVRSFLQAKGKINKGIRSTILGSANRFLAYNNGISVTAESVEFEKLPDGGLILTRARDFQIVNGGQTTASIYHAHKRDEADLSELMIQAKITVLTDPKNIDEFVPLISQYANSQNKVNAADFSANNPYHVKIEELSRRIWAPALSGTQRQTHWYYERSRGSYFDDKIKEGTPARIRAFEALNPIRQKFTKTDLAKFESTWNQYPHLVSRGAETNFIKLTEIFLDKGYPVPDEAYFHRLVAKAILFRTAEKIVSAENYGGYRANIVTYSLAWLAHRTAQRIDLDKIWKDQKISENLFEAIKIISKFANKHILDTPAKQRNPSQWAKQEECWDKFKDEDIDLSKNLDAELISTSPKTGKAYGEAIEATEEETKQINEISKVPADTWFKISGWAKQTNNLAPWQRAIAYTMGRYASINKLPSIKQARQAAIIIEEANRRGFKENDEQV